MKCKFTTDGKKVAVIGALNSTETIVQEMFVSDGAEFPGGEQFVVKTLLDKPAETYKAKEERMLKEYIKKLETERDKLQNDIKQFKFAAKAAAEKIKWIQSINEPEIERVFENIKSIICCEYTHVVFNDYNGIKIAEWNAELFSSSEGYGGDLRFDGIRLVSLFGVWNKRLELDWRVNTYKDGSGTNHSFIPCKSYEEAVEKVKEIIYTKEFLSDKDYDLCIKYSIPIDETKNAARINDKAKNIRKQMAEKQKQMAELESILKRLK